MRKTQASVAYLSSWERVGITVQTHNVKQQLFAETHNALGDISI